MKKQILAVMLIFILFVCMIPYTVSATEIASGTCGAEGDNLTWVLTDDGTLTISGTGEMADSSYPFWADNRIKFVNVSDGVTSIGCHAFQDCINLISVALPQSIYNIGEFAFSSCSSLENIEIPYGVESIENATFSGCTSLSSITLPDSLESIERYAFNGCIALDNVKIPCSVTAIGTYAFYNCNNLKNVTIAKGVKIISSHAFNSCSNLVSISIPSSVESIEDGVFYRCESLKNIEISAGVANITTSAFNECTSLTDIMVSEENVVYSSVNGILYNKTKTDLLRCPEGKTGTISIWDGTTTVCTSAFNNCDNVEEIILSDSVIRIEDKAFSGCNKIQSIYIPNKVSNIGSQIFKDCGELKSITVSETNTTFSSADGILYSKAKDILYICPQGKVSPVNILDSVTTIQVSAFSQCIRLKDIVIPSNVINIGDGAFASCTALVDVYFLGDAPTLNGKSVFPSRSAMYYIPGTDNWTDNTDYETQTSWNGYILRAWQGDSESIIDGMSGLCGYNLTWSFNEHGILTIAGTGKMYTYDSVDSKWSAPYPWHNIKEKITSVIISNGVTTISEYAFNGCAKLTNVELHEGLIEIDSYAFCGCSELKGISIPKSVNFIGGNAFSRCSNLVIIDLPSGISEVSAGLFEGCVELESIWMPDSVTKIGGGAFMGCNSLQGIRFSNNLKVIGEAAFNGCNALTRMELPEGVTDVWLEGLNCGLNLEKLIIPSSLTNFLGEGCILNSNPKLITAGATGGNYSIEFGWKEKIPAYAFFECINLTSITIPETISRIGDYAFWGCTGLSEIYFPSDAPALNDALTVFPSDIILYYLPGTNGWTDSAAYDSQKGTWHGYTLREWNEPEQKDEYELTSITIRNTFGEGLPSIPATDFWATVSIKNVSSERSSMVLLASYDADGRYIGMNVAWIESAPIGTTVSVGFMVSNGDGKVDTVKAFCVESFSNMIPLSEPLTIT